MNPRVTVEAESGLAERRLAVGFEVAVDPKPVANQHSEQPSIHPSPIHHPSSIIHHPGSLRVGAFEPRSLVNGPGARAVLWVQGCGRRCPGCFNPEFLPHASGRLVPVAEVIQWIRDALTATQPSIHPPIHQPNVSSSVTHHPSTALEGVSFSGGEPFDQAVELAVVARAARQMGLGVLIFTGHPWADLQHSDAPGHRALLETADLLVAGPYERDASIHQSNDAPSHSSTPARAVFVQPAPHPLLASANQQLVFLTDRYRDYDFGKKRRMEFRIGPDGTIRSTGFPSPSIIHPSQIPQPCDAHH